MLTKFTVCRRMCCGRKAAPIAPKPSSHAAQVPTQSSSLHQSMTVLNPSPHGLVQSVQSREASPRQLSRTDHELDLDRLIDEYVNTINQYRGQLDHPSLLLSKELSIKALKRARVLSQANQMENTPNTDLTWNGEPIGETYVQLEGIS